MSHPSTRPRLILASRSPRRRELLTDAGYAFDVLPPADESESGIEPGEDPQDYVQRLAQTKAEGAASQLQGRTAEGLYVVVGCDTVAECRGQILGKPTDKRHARQMLELLSGSEHRVISGLCVWPLPNGRPQTAVEATILRMDKLTAKQIDEYLASGQWRGKAGAFGYQDRLDWLHIVAGSESNVVGLPLELLARMLADIP